jgi:hypothetical protein
VACRIARADTLQQLEAWRHRKVDVEGIVHVRELVYSSVRPADLGGRYLGSPLARP